VYEAAVQRRFQDYISDEEAELLVRIWHRVLEGNNASCKPITAAAEALPERA
jgi:hypothetical protein